MRSLYRLFFLTGVTGVMLATPGISSATPVKFVAPIREQFVVPASGSLGSGVGVFTLNEAQDTAVYTIGFSGLSSPCTGLDIHVGALYEVGPIILHLDFTPSTGEQLARTIPWPPSLRQYTLSPAPPRLYLEVDTQNFPSGELVGPLLDQRVFVTPAKPTTWGALKKLFR